MIVHLKGDATEPMLSEGKTALICHVCNDIGAWGKGFVLAISRRWKAPEEHYRQWFRSDKPKLGEVRAIKVTDNIIVVNMIAQHDIRSINGIPPIRYWAIRKALGIVAQQFHDPDKYELHCPKFGSGLAGGDWNAIEDIIADVFPANKIYIYTP